LATITIQDVADHAGVSIKTVSRVVNKEAAVKDSTREKVLASIKLLGYSPNQAARGLAGNKSYLIGLLYDNPSAAYVMALQQGVLDVCESEGFSLLIRSCAFDSSQLIDEIVQLTKTSRLDGLLLTPPLSDNKQLVNALKLAGVALVAISPMDETLAAFVQCNETEAVKQLIKHLIALGHRDIGFIKGHPAHGSSHIREKAFRDAMAESGLKVKAAHIKQGDFTFESGARCAKSLLDSKTAPTAIFASNDYMAAGVIKEATQRGLGVPGDLSVAGFDDAPVATQLWPSLTTIKQPVRQIARQAATALIAEIRKDKLEDHTPEKGLSCELILRGSTAKAAAEVK
jgi:LacI family transcriptional regulator